MDEKFETWNYLKIGIGGIINKMGFRKIIFKKTGDEGMEGDM